MDTLNVFQLVEPTAVFSFTSAFRITRISACGYILNDGSSTALSKLCINGAGNSDKGSILNTQKVVFHAYINNNIRSTILF